ncbi:hypothetical protein [Limimaricola hongkongensis]|uniref:Porin domain-containing protein n=1 Tax=Limimaricola hongkongensis DSM 17492 TaxID=1122180 RepID=A0A017HD34_9RHOB|nr:hypothetical protein [Limimaricola hongkongensis]EYD72220.1 hypothetical protein Lokhon_01013 [Limimaricola hongkongensis DSM 17492]
MITRAIMAAAFGLVAAGAQAQGFAGGVLSVETSAFFEEGDIGYTTYAGGLQFDIGAGFGVEADLASYGFSGFGSDGSNATLHAIFDIGPLMVLGDTSVGAFVGRDGYDDGDSTIFGIEGKGELYGLRSEAYLARHDGDLGEITLAGLGARYDITHDIYAMGDLGLADGGGEGELLRAALGGGYRIDGGPRLWGELGRIEADDDAFTGDETYLAIGAEIGFGPNAGTTFGSRSLFDIVPGL